MSHSGPRFGVLAPPTLPPREIPQFARHAEQAGVEEVWFAEDCFFAGGIATASAALAATRHVTIGLGILPAVARNPAFIAMEIATLAELYPARVTVGLGHGMRGWMRQIGALPRSPLTALEEYLDAVRALLAGTTVTTRGEYVSLDRVSLDHPPEQVPAVIAGVRGPKSLHLSGAHADGTMLAWPISDSYIRRAREHIDTGRHAAGRSEHHLLIVGTPVAIDPDAKRARDLMRPLLAAELSGPTSHAHLEPLGLADDVAALVTASASVEDLAARLPEEWIDALVIAGDVTRCADRIADLHRAGADTVLVGVESADPAARDKAWRDLSSAVHRASG